jgi:hypothetical protein
VLSDSVQSQEGYAHGLRRVEWLVASRVSIHVEYGVESVYAKTVVTTKNVLQDTEGSQDGETRDIGPPDVLFGVSAYF